MRRPLKISNVFAFGLNVLVAALACAAPASALTRWYVDAGALPGGDGLSWATAFRSPDEGLGIAQIGDKIWVKTGTYTTATPTDPADIRTATFDVRPGVTIRGGFDGTETTFAQRAGLFDQTILTGDIGVLGDPTDNAYRVVNAVHASGIPPGATRIDGFTIRDGYGINAPGYEQGGGVHMFNAGLSLLNCTIRDNTAVWGAGLHAQPAAATLRWCTFIDNHAVKNGGGLWGQAVNYKISHCIFRGNTAERGGAVFLNSIFGDSPGALPPVLIHNSLFHDNSAERGGAIYLGGGAFASGKMTLLSSTIAYNSATLAGGGIWAATAATIPAKSSLANSIIWFNSAPLHPNLRGRHEALFCNYEDGTTGARMSISSDPLFVNGPQRDLRLAAGSPSSDTGLGVLLPPDFADVDADGDKQERVPWDLDRERRIQDDPSAPAVGRIVDMGAYER